MKEEDPDAKIHPFENLELAMLSLLLWPRPPSSPPTKDPSALKKCDI